MGDATTSTLEAVYFGLFYKATWYPPTEGSWAIFSIYSPLMHTTLRQSVSAQFAVFTLSAACPSGCCIPTLHLFQASLQGLLITLNAPLTTASTRHHRRPSLPFLLFFSSWYFCIVFACLVFFVWKERASHSFILCLKRYVSSLFFFHELIMLVV